MTIHPVSVCGLLASPMIDYHAWQTAFYHQELTDLDPGVTKEFIELQVDREALALGVTVDVLLATLHHGYIFCCPGIDFADQEVIAEVELRRFPVESTFTVCGIFAGTGLCYSGLWVGRGPRMAYAAAYHHYIQLDGRQLLVAGVHEGVVERAAESPVWADPSCISEATMRSRWLELVPDREAGR